MDGGNISLEEGEVKKGEKGRMANKCYLEESLIQQALKLAAQTKLST